MDTVTPPPHRLFRIWQRMVEACTQPMHADYAAHGALGIMVCAVWQQSFASFSDWAMGSNYADDRFLIRIRIDEGFDPMNCWWVDAQVYQRYLHYIRPVAGGGQVLPLGRWLTDERCHVDLPTFLRLLAQGWSVERILTKPPEIRQRGRKYPFAYNGIPPGMIFGQLTVTGLPDIVHSPSGWKHYSYPCRCTCGTTDHWVLDTNLLNGEVFSCGCYRRKTQGTATLTHGDARKSGVRPLYHIWRRVMAVCTNPRHRNYPLYGQRGIAVCLEWQQDYAAFRTWAEATGYRTGLRLERQDQHGDFTPANCYWTATAPRTSRSQLLTFAGETKSLAEWARDPRRVVSSVSVVGRVQRGWSLEDALFVALQRKASSPAIRAFGEHKSLMAWSRDPRCLVHWQCLHGRLRAGWEAETAMTIPSGGTRPGLEAFGEEHSVAAWVRDHRCVVTEAILRQRLKQGWEAEAALTTPTAHRKRGMLYEAFETWRSLVEWARDARCIVPLPTLRSRVDAGWNFEAALTTPPYRQPHAL